MENNDQEIIYIALNGEELFKHSKANVGLIPNKIACERSNAFEAM